MRSIGDVAGRLPAVATDCAPSVELATPATIHTIALAIRWNDILKPPVE
jgi:hypothetical protein